MAVTTRSRQGRQILMFPFPRLARPHESPSSTKCSTRATNSQFPIPRMCVDRTRAEAPETFFVRVQEAVEPVLRAKNLRGPKTPRSKRRDTQLPWAAMDQPNPARNLVSEAHTGVCG